MQKELTVFVVWLLFLVGLWGAAVSGSPPALSATLLRVSPYAVLASPLLYVVGLFLVKGIGHREDVGTDATAEALRRDWGVLLTWLLAHAGVAVVLSTPLWYPLSRDARIVLLAVCVPALVTSFFMAAVRAVTVQGHRCQLGDSRVPGRMVGLLSLLWFVVSELALIVPVWVLLKARRRAATPVRA
jgi:hypothetical protein